MDQLESEDQETIQRIKEASKYHPQTWTYNLEPRVQTPDVDKLIDQFRQMPSLAMKTQFTEIKTSKFSSDHQNINEMCLNYQFDAGNINKIVQNVLSKTIDDETLRQTLLIEFRKSLSNKGREFAIEDINRRLNIINEMIDSTQSFQEAKSLIGNFDKIFTGIRQKLQYNQQAAVVQDNFSLLRLLHTIQWPENKSQSVESIQKEFNQMFFGCYANVFNGQLIDVSRFQIYKPYIEFAISVDMNNDLEALLNPKLKPIFAKLRAQHYQQMNM